MNSVPIRTLLSYPPMMPYSPLMQFSFPADDKPTAGVRDPQRAPHQPGFDLSLFTERKPTKQNNLENPSLIRLNDQEYDQAA